MEIRTEPIYQKKNPKYGRWKTNCLPILRDHRPLIMLSWCFWEKRGMMMTKIIVSKKLLGCLLKRGHFRALQRANQSLEAAREKSKQKAKGLSTIRVHRRANQRKEAVHEKSKQKTKGVSMIRLRQRASQRNEAVREKSLQKTTGVPTIRITRRTSQRNEVVRVRTQRKIGPQLLQQRRGQHFLDHCRMCYSSALLRELFFVPWILMDESK